MIVFITLASIYLITLAAWILKKFTKWNICPICVGVCATWIWLLVAKFTNMQPFGYEIPDIIPAVLMGGSVVGIAYQIEKKMPVASMHSASSLSASSRPASSLSTSSRSTSSHASFLSTPFAWKILFIPIGFAAVYSVYFEWWKFLTGFILVAIPLIFYFLSGAKTGAKKQTHGSAEEIKKKMENCC